MEIDGAVKADGNPGVGDGSGGGSGGSIWLKAKRFRGRCSWLYKSYIISIIIIIVVVVVVAVVVVMTMNYPERVYAHCHLSRF